MAVRVAGGIVLLLALGACTVVNVGAGHRVTTLRPGILQIVPAPGATTMVYRTQGLGLVPGRTGPTLGWAREDAVLLYDPSQCRIVVLQSAITADARAFWSQYLKDDHEICVAGGKP